MAGKKNKFKGFQVDESLLKPRYHEKTEVEIDSLAVRSRGTIKRKPVKNCNDIISVYLTEGKKIFYFDEVKNHFREKHINENDLILSLKDLVAKKEVIKGSINKKNVYWSSSYKFLEVPYLTEKLEIFELEVPEGSAWKCAKSYLPGIFIKKGELVSNPELLYMPLFKITIPVTYKKGLPWDRELVERMENLYIDGFKGDICTVCPERGVRLNRIITEKPYRIEDFDDYGRSKQVLPGDLNLDYTLFSGLLSGIEVKDFIYKRFLIYPDKISLTLFPYWEILAKSPDFKDVKKIHIDSIYGKRFYRTFE